MHFPTLLPLLFLILLLCPVLSHNEKKFTDQPCEVSIVGAGIGGMYTAYRLAVEARAVNASSICIFEASSRPGGRILSVNDPIPGFKGFTVDIGAYRYRRSQHILTRLLTEEALNLSTICYTQALRSDGPLTAACDPNTPRRILSMRGKVFGAAKTGPSLTETLAKFSEEIPYHLPPEGQWGVPGPGANLTGPRTSSYLLGTLVSPSATPVRLLAEYLPTVVDPSSSYAAAMAAANIIIAGLPEEKLLGVPLKQLTLIEYAVRMGIAPDERRLITDLGGILTAESLHAPLTFLIVNYVRDAAIGKAPVRGVKEAYVIPIEKKATGNGIAKQDFPPRASLIVIIDELLHRLKKAGVRVHLNTRATGVHRIPGTERMRIDLSQDNGSNKRCTAVESGTVFLNIPKTELDALGTSSEPMRSGSQQFKNAASRFFQVSMAKTYCLWREAWWLSKLNFTSGSFRTSDEPLFEGRYHDGDVQCTDPKNKTTCRGSLLVSYVGGSSVGTDDTAWLQAVNPRQTSPFMPDVTNRARFLVPGNMTEHEQLHFEHIHTVLRRVHSDAFSSRGLNVSVDLPDADGCVYANWVRMGSHRPRGGALEEESGNPYPLFAQPVPGLNLSLVNEGWAEKHGWAEASLRAAERALFHVHGIQKPSWMDEVTHRALIEDSHIRQKSVFEVSS